MNRTRRPRSPEEIKHTILNEILKGIAPKTRIMSQSCLNFESFEKYFKYLSENGYLSSTDKDTYEITPKGKKLHEKLDDVVNVLYNVDNLPGIMRTRRYSAF